MSLRDSSVKCIGKHLIRSETSHYCHQNENKKGRVSFLNQGKISLHWRNFGERVPSIFLAKIMAAIFDFNGSGRLGRERNLYKRELNFPTPLPSAPPPSTNQTWPVK